MNNKKGFTLIEILSVLVIMGIIAGIALNSQSNIKKLLLEEEYNNLITYIETKAEIYANEYYVTAVNVQTLIDLGYITSDDGFVYSPLDSEVLNCHVITTDLIDGSYEAKFSNSVGLDENNTCNTYDYSQDFGIKIVENKDLLIEKTYILVNNNVWYKGDVCLLPLIPDKYNDIEDNMEFTWSNNIGQSNILDNSYCIDVTNKSYIATISLNIKYKEDEVNKINSVSKEINIDNENPQLSVTLNNTSVKIVTSDGNGSGINSINTYYCINENCDVFITNQTNFNVEDNGKYKIVVTDNVGNESEEFVEVENLIDITPPTVEIEMVTTNIVSSDFEVKFTFKDDLSGVAGYSVSKSSITPSIFDLVDPSSKEYEITKTFNEADKYYIYAIDLAGNISSLYDFSISSDSFDNKNPEIDFDNSTLDLTCQTLYLDPSFNLILNIIDENDVSAQLIITQSNVEPNNWKNYNTNYSVYDYGFIDNVDNYIWVKLTDIAGNSTTYNVSLLMGYLSGHYCESLDLGDQFIKGSLAEKIMIDDNNSANINDAIDYIKLKKEVTYNLYSSKDEGLNYIEDNFGTSYYFRGNVEDNYVKFADMLWRIVRIDGEGNVRLMLYNESTSGDSYTGMNSGSGYKFNEDGNKSYYSGYMYTEDEPHGFKDTSTLKVEIDKWYADKLINYKSYISDTAIYCADRTAYKQTNYSTPQEFEYYGDNYYNDSSIIYFGGYYRNYKFSSNEEVSPSLKCVNSSDAFTVSSTTGNGNLTYGIALLSIDEVMIAGITSEGENNKNNYLYTGTHYRLISPAVYQWQEVANFYVSSNGYIKMISHDYTYRVFPVISLNKSVQIEDGNGTQSNPYIVK